MTAPPEPESSPSEPALPENPARTPAPRPAAPRRPSLGRLVLVAVGLFLLLTTAAELLARRFVPPLPPTYCVHPYAAHVWSPDLALEYRTRHGQGELMTLETDAFGFRGRSLRTVEKPPGTKRVFFLGASVIAGVDFKEEETIPGLVESALNERWKGSPRLEVANAAHSGVPIEHTFATFAHLVLPFKPDVVVLYEGMNDELESVDPAFDPTHYAERVENPDDLSRWLAARSRLVQLSARLRMKRGHNPFLERPAGAAARGRPGASPDAPPPPFDPEPGFRCFERYLRMIGAIARAEGVQLVVTTQPSLWSEEPLPEAERQAIRYAHRSGDRVSVADLARVHRRYTEAVRAFAREGGWPLADAEPLVPRRLSHFLDDVHLTLEGNKAVARVIAERIAAPGP